MSSMKISSLNIKITKALSFLFTVHVD